MEKYVPRTQRSGEYFDKFFKVARRLMHDVERNIVKNYEPYGLSKQNQIDGITWQLDFHNAGKDNLQRYLMAANQVGKSFAGTAEDSYHLTGRYPEWWDGYRFDKPVLMWACGVSNEKVRDSLQDLLLGDPADPGTWGTGAIPYEYLEKDASGGIKYAAKQNVPNAVSYIRVKHISGGWSKLMFKAYEMKKKGFMSQKVDVIHLDEEPRLDIMGSCVVRQINNKGIMYMTFTPENGYSEVVSQVMNDIQPGQFLINASWADAPHMTEERKKAILRLIPAHERDMRAKGIPMPGDGLVFPVADDDIKCQAFKIPDHFYRITGLDIGGWNHPTAAVCIAWDKDSDMVYVTATYKSQERSPAVHCQAVRRFGDHITIIYPHDAEKGDRKSGESYAQEWRDMGASMHYTHFTNPPAQGQDEGQGGNAVSPGLIHMYERMLEGKFKVFEHLEDWFKEKRMYHTRDGKLVRKNEDLMSATRYAVMSLRFAVPVLNFNNKPIMSDGDFDVF